MDGFATNTWIREQAIFKTMTMSFVPEIQYICQLQAFSRNGVNVKVAKNNKCLVLISMHVTKVLDVLTFQKKHYEGNAGLERLEHDNGKVIQ